MKDNIIKIKFFDFAVAVVKCCASLVKRNEFVLSKQLLRSGTAIDANVREALYASSRRDFLYRLSISLRECSETLFWLELLFASNWISETDFQKLHDDANELMRILTSITNTLKNK